MGRHPDWLRVRIPGGDEYFDVRNILRRHELNTVCEDARCPNIAECWGRHRTATFMILGDTCTRACAYCAVRSGVPGAVDEGEPERVARAVADLGLRHAVITSVDRDDLADGGAGIFARTVGQIRKLDPDVRIELLTPDFGGSVEALRTVLDSGPDIFSHNLETVGRLYPRVRFRSDYSRSLGLLGEARRYRPHIRTKTGLMLGLGEELDEIWRLIDDVRAMDVDILTMGQYLTPTPKHAPIARYYSPEEFDRLGEGARERGIRWVFSGPLVRSSYHAEDVFRELARAGSEV
jgi:lipoic acid synthetase